MPNPANPQDLNRFSYVRNNPVRYSDPTGHYVYEEGPDDPAVWWRNKPPQLRKTLVRGRPYSFIDYQPLARPRIGYFQATRYAFNWTWDRAWEWEYTPAIAKFYNYVSRVNETILNEPYDTMIIGGNMGYIPPPAGGGPTEGGEIVWNLSSDEISFFTYDGESGGSGGGGSVSGYVGFAWNVEQNNDYKGRFESLDVTFAIPAGGRLIVFWAPPFSPDGAFGFAAGPAGGLEFSIVGSRTNYVERQRVLWPWK